MFIEQAYKGDNTPWRVILTAMLCCGIFLMNFVLLFLMSPEEMKQVYQMMRGIPNNLALALNLIPFALLLGLLIGLVYLLHRRNLLSLTTARTKVDFKRIRFSFVLIVSLTILSFGISYFIDSSQIRYSFDPIKFSILVIVSILLFPMQIAFEEYLFRGFLMQQLGVASKNRWFPLLTTSILFGLFHSANPEVAELGFGVMAFYIGTGLLLGIITLMDDGIELALGFHFGNNLMAALLISSDFSALQTDALFKYTGIVDTTGILTEMILSIAITYPIILLILAKKYRWNSWREKLTSRVTAISRTTDTYHEQPEFH